MRPTADSRDGPLRQGVVNQGRYGWMADPRGGLMTIHGHTLRPSAVPLR